MTTKKKIIVIELWARDDESIDTNQVINGIDKTLFNLNDAGICEWQPTIVETFHDEFDVHLELEKKVQEEKEY